MDIINVNMVASIMEQEHGLPHEAELIRTLEEIKPRSMITIQLGDGTDSEALKKMIMDPSRAFQKTVESIYGEAISGVSCYVKEVSNNDQSEVDDEIVGLTISNENSYGYSTYRVGKHNGRSLPEILFHDADYFYWALESGCFDGPEYYQQSRDVDLKSRRIRVPQLSDEEHWMAEYWCHAIQGDFEDVRLVPSSRPAHTGLSATFRKDVIDLSVPRSLKERDWSGNQIMGKRVRGLFFGNENVELSRADCEAFFADENNFIPIAEVN